MLSHWEQCNKYIVTCLLRLAATAAAAAAAAAQSYI